MPTRNASSEQTYPYDEMYKELRTNVRRGWPRLIIGLAILGGVLGGWGAWLTNPRSLSFYGLVGGESVLVVGGAAWLLLLLLSWSIDTLRRGWLVTRGMTHLKKTYAYDTYSDAAIEAIDQRAEIRIAAAQVQVVLPVLLIPILYPVLIQHPSMDARLWEGIALWFIAIALPFAIAIDRVPADRAMREAIVEWRREKEQPKTPQPQSQAPTPNDTTGGQNATDHPFMVLLFTAAIMAIFSFFGRRR